MPDYRIYQLQAAPNRIVGSPTIVTYKTDAEAIEHARRLLDSHDIEIWEGVRVVIRLRSREGSLSSRQTSAMPPNAKSRDPAG